MMQNIYPNHSPASLRAGHPLVALYLYILLLFAGFGNISVLLELSEKPINYFHFIALLGLPLLIFIRRISLPPLPLMLFMLSAGITSMVAYLFLGVLSDNPWQPVYCIVMLFLGLAIGGYLPVMMMKRVLMAVGLSYIALVLIKNMVFQPEILDMMLQGQRVWIPTLSLGEVNSEATFLIISATFLFGTVYFWPSLGLVAYLILLYSSRASFISLAALVLYILLVQRRRGSGISRLSKHIFLTVVMVMAAVILVLSPLGQFMLGRFGDIGYEPGTLTRFLIWEQAMDVLLHHPFGVGAQNGFALVQLSEAGTLIEDNLHSIFLQYAVDLGIHSLLFFLFAIYHTIRQMPKAMLGHPLTLALLSFGTLALSHYSGYETFFYLWLGLWLGQWHDARRNVAHD